MKAVAQTWKYNYYHSADQPGGGPRQRQRIQPKCSPVRSGSMSTSSGGDRGDGGESSVCTNLATTLSRLHCCLEQHQQQSETPFLISTYPSGHVFQILDQADDRVERANFTRFQQVEQQICSCPVDRLALLLRQEPITRLLQRILPVMAPVFSADRGRRKSSVGLRFKQA